MGLLGMIPVVTYCIPCVHYRFLYQNGKHDSPKVCLYILDAGHSRGCPAGKGCCKRASAAQWEASRQGTVQAEQLAHNSAGGKQTRTHTPWNAEADAQLLQLRASGLTAKQIAAHMGKTESAVASRVRDLKKRGVLQSHN